MLKYARAFTATTQARWAATLRELTPRSRYMRLGCGTLPPSLSSQEPNRGIFGLDVNTSPGELRCDSPVRREEEALIGGRANQQIQTNVATQRGTTSCRSSVAGPKVMPQ